MDALFIKDGIHRNHDGQLLWMRDYIRPMIETLVSEFDLTQVKKGGLRMQAIRLKTEHLINPTGVDFTVLRLSWNCSDGKKQTAYQIVAANSAIIAAGGFA